METCQQNYYIFICYSRRDGYNLSATTKNLRVDFLTKQRPENKGLVPQYYVENSLETISSIDFHAGAGGIGAPPLCPYLPKTSKNETSAAHTACRSSFSAAAAESFTAGIHWHNRGKKSVVWRCISRLENISVMPTPCRKATRCWPLSSIRYGVTATSSSKPCKG